MDGDKAPLVAQCALLAESAAPRRPLALGLLSAQHYQTNAARLCEHLHLKVFGGAAPKTPLCRGLCQRRGLLALGQAPCARGLADNYGYCTSRVNIALSVQ
jgi:hypothetical protein